MAPRAQETRQQSTTSNSPANSDSILSLSYHLCPAPCRRFNRVRSSVHVCAAILLIALPRWCHSPCQSKHNLLTCLPVCQVISAVTPLHAHTVMVARVVGCIKKLLGLRLGEQMRASLGTCAGKLETAAVQSDVSAGNDPRAATPHGSVHSHHMRSRSLTPLLCATAAQVAFHRGRKNVRARKRALVGHRQPCRDG